MKRDELVDKIDNAIPEGTPLNMIGDAFIFYLVANAKFYNIEKSIFIKNVLFSIDTFWDIIKDNHLDK